jgi:phosphatidylglycerophosphate synthase
VTITDLPVTTFRSSLEALRTAQKGRKGAPPYSLFVNRPLGRVFAAAAHTAGLRPNQVTVLSACFTFAAIAVLALGPATWWVGLPVAAGLVVGYALDSADGQLARLQGGGSLTGEWLDHMIDSVKVSVLHLAVLITMYRSFVLENELWLLVPLVFAAASGVHFFGMILIELMARVRRAERPDVAPAAPAPSLRNTLLKLPTDFGVLSLAFALLGAHAVFLGVYAFLALATTGYTLLVVGKWYRDVRGLDEIGVAP